MAYCPKLVANWEPLRRAEFGDIGASYLQMGDPSTHVIVMIRIRSTLNEDVLLSFDGINDQFFIRSPADQLQIDMGAQRQGDGVYVRPRGTKVYVKHDGTPPTSGTIGITFMFAQ